MKPATTYTLLPLERPLEELLVAFSTHDSRQRKQNTGFSGISVDSAYVQL